jgi:hypothetical protein
VKCLGAKTFTSMTPPRTTKIRDLKIQMKACSPHNAIKKRKAEQRAREPASKATIPARPSIVFPTVTSLIHSNKRPRYISFYPSLPWQSSTSLSSYSSPSYGPSSARSYAPSSSSLYPDASTTKCARKWIQIARASAANINSSALSTLFWV